MPVSVTLDPETGIWIFEIRGSASPEELLERYRAMREHPEFRSEAPRLWDARDAQTDSSFRATDLQNIVLRTGTRADHRVAVVVAREVEYGFSRMYQAYAEVNRHMARSRIFRDRDEAVAWLLEPASPERSEGPGEPSA